MGLAFVAAGVAGAAVGSARVARHEARTAADLGALAGAAKVIEGDAAACAAAARYVTANAARLTSCRLQGWEIVIQVEITATPLPNLTRQVRAAARAGPVYVVG